MGAVAQDLWCGGRAGFRRRGLWPASAGIDGFFISGMGSRKGLADVATRTEAGVDETADSQAFERRAIGGHALALVVRPEGTAEIGSFVPLEAKPSEVLRQGLDEGGLAAGAVEILVAKDQFALELEAALVGHPEGPRVTEVE